MLKGKAKFFQKGVIMSLLSQNQTLQINNIPPDKMDALKEKASKSGATPEEYALRLIVEGLSLQEHAINELLDLDYMAACGAEADPTVTLASVRQALSKIPGSMTADFIAERDER